MYAQVIDNTIARTRSTLPDKARRLDTGDTVLGFPSADAETVAACGWFSVTDDGAPLFDDATQKMSRTVEVIGGVPVVVYSVTDLDSEELAANVSAEADRSDRSDLIERGDGILAAFLADDSPTAAEVIRAVKVLARAQRARFRQGEV